MLMDKKMLSVAVVGAAVVAGAVAMSLAPKPSEHTTEATGKEQCFGVAKAGENGCAAVNGSHGCGGMSKLDYDGQEWTLVEAGTCVQMGGKLEAFEGTGTPPADATQGG
jgi:uncharacterized membrane protein